MRARSETETADTWPIVDFDDPKAQQLLRAKVAEALADPRPSLSQDEVFEQLQAHHEARQAARKG